jgi:hypothetical protein
LQIYENYLVRLLKLFCNTFAELILTKSIYGTPGFLYNKKEGVILNHPITAPEKVAIGLGKVFCDDGHFYFRILFAKY